MKSAWVRFRDKMEEFFGVAVNAAAPIAEDVLVTTGKAVLHAAANGTPINSKDMAHIALNSIHEQVPGIEASVSLAAAGLVLHNAQVAAQEADAPLAVPPASLAAQPE